MEHVSLEALQNSLYRTAFVPSKGRNISEGRALDVWCAHSGAPDLGTDTSPGKNNTPHHTEVLTELRSLLDTFGATQTALLYIHRGHQPLYRTPLLQSLLAQLPDMASYLSHRLESDELTNEVFALLRALLHRSPNVILLWDRLDRLQIAPKPSALALQILPLCRQSGGAVVLQESINFHEHPPLSNSNSQL